MPLIPLVSKNITLTQSASSLANKVDGSDVLENARRLFPHLTDSLRKGDCGRIGVIGGSQQYTGAPYFASISSIRTGADLSYLFCHPEAASVIKSYNPELMVEPTLNFDKMEPALGRLHAIIFGPGIGRDLEHCVPLLKSVLAFIAKNSNLCLVIDADGLFVLGECLTEVKGLKNQVILTPNHREFDRLFKQAFPNKRDDESELKRTELLALHLDVCILRKGEEDIITNGHETRIGKVRGTLRRCGGQGDILSSIVALFAYWAKLQDCQKNDANPIDFSFESKYLIDGALAASDFVRFTAAQTFRRIGRSMTAGDIIDEISDVVHNYIDSNKIM